MSKYEKLVLKREVLSRWASLDVGERPIKYVCIDLE